MRNHTVLTTFILLGLTEDPQLQVLILVFLFLTYLLSISGNLTIIILTFLNSPLKTPMHFFLETSQKSHSQQPVFPGSCIAYQVGTIALLITPVLVKYFSLDILEPQSFFLLVAMSYDQYVAICKPLHYMTIMNGRVCTILVFCCWKSGLMIIITPLNMGFLLEFCDSNAIDHFGCDAAPLFKISCSDA